MDQCLLARFCAPTVAAPALSSARRALRLAPGAALVAGALIALSLAPQLAAAQPADAGTLLRDQPKPPPSLPEKTAPVVPANPGQAPAASSAVKIMVKSFRLRGAKLIPEADLQKALAPFSGRELSFAELQKAADAVAQAYQSRGLLARAFLPEQDLKDGVVTIAVVEGKLGAVRIDRKAGEPLRLRESTIQRFIAARNQPGQPINTADAQRAVNLLNDLPGVQASALLEPGTQEGESVIVVKARDTQRASGFVQADNAGVASTGRVRLTGTASLDDPLGIGDQLLGTGSFSQHSQYGRAGYSAPIGGDGLRASIAGSALHYSYDDTTRFKGSAQTFTLGAVYPIHRDNDWNLNLGAAFDANHFRNDNEAVGTTTRLSDKRTKILSVTLSGNASDGLGGGGYSNFSATLGSGRLDLGGEETDLLADQAVNGPKRQGDYQKLSLFASRLQRLTSADSLSLTLTGQAASKNLDSSEKISTGGPNAVRAYPAGEGNADDATIVNIELQHRFGDTFRASVFYDVAWLQRDHDAYPGSASPNSLNLQGAGIGLGWGDPKVIAVTASVAARIGANHLPNPVTGADPSGSNSHARGWIAISRSF